MRFYYRNKFHILFFFVNFLLHFYKKNEKIGFQFQRIISDRYIIIQIINVYCMISICIKNCSSTFYYNLY